MVRRCYSSRCLRRFAGFLGLIEVEELPTTDYESRFRVRKRPLLDDAVTFHLG
ncbi:MAG TPA: hypothetical protein VGM37_16310 [Armatimonadota bacterium]